MSDNTIKWVIGLGIAYYFLTTRTPMYTQQANGSFAPSTFIDALTASLTGAMPPPPVQPSTAQTLVNLVNQLIPATGATT
jgi:hypothetical protein